MRAKGKILKLEKIFREELGRKDRQVKAGMRSAAKRFIMGGGRKHLLERAACLWPEL